MLRHQGKLGDTEIFSISNEAWVCGGCRKESLSVYRASFKMLSSVDVISLGARKSHECQ